MVGEVVANFGIVYVNYDEMDLSELAQKWLNRLADADKREEDWSNDAKASERAYSGSANGDVGKVYEFNILHSNVETIVPAIYNSTPVPDVRDRHRTGNQIVRDVAEIYERVIAQMIDDNALDTEIEASAQDTFMAGRGVVRVKFDADVTETDPQITLNEMGQPVEVPQGPTVSNESLGFEVVSWRDYREGPASRWSDVPWVAFRHWFDNESLEDIADPAIKGGDGITEGKSDADGDVEVWEIWCRESGRVYFLNKTASEILKVVDDPLELTGFFPVHRPVQPITLTGRRTPVCPFTIYKKLADELDETTRRINVIIKGLKVRGWIVGASDDVAKIEMAGDNELIPLSGFQNAAATGGIDKAIVWWPVDTAIVVLRELYATREQTKQAIYEITGISDIVRGASQSAETATAQQIKTQWGSLRIKKMQRLIERQVRDLFVICSEIIASKFSTETLMKISGIEITEQHEALLRDPAAQYRIDVESDSTVRADLSRMRGELGEFLNGTAQYFNVMAPLVAQAPEAAEPVADIYGAFARLHNLGKQGEDAIERLIEIAKGAAKEPRPNPEAEAAQAQAQADAQSKAQEQEVKGQELTIRAREAEAKSALAQAQFEWQKIVESTNMKFQEAELFLKYGEAKVRAELESRKIDAVNKKDQAA